VIKGYKANPHYVVPEEDHVNTRFFFVFPSGSSANVDAGSLNVPDLTGKKLKQKKTGWFS